MVILAIPVSISILFMDPAVQTVTARFSAAYLSGLLGSEVFIGRLQITPLMDLKLKEVYVEDAHGDTLLYSSRIFVDVGMPDIGEKLIRIRKVGLHTGAFFLHKYEEDTAFNITYFANVFKGDPAEKGPRREPWNVGVMGLELANVQFRLIDDTKPRKPGGMDFTDLNVRVADLDIRGITINKDTVSCMVQNLTCKEKSGMTVDRLTGKFWISPSFLVAEKMQLKTPDSDVKLDFSFHYDHWKAYNDFIHEINILADIQPSQLNLKDIGYFAPGLQVMDNRIRIKGEFSGTVDNLKARGFRFSYGKDTRFRGEISMNGLPDFENTFIHLAIEHMQASVQDVETFSIPGEENRIELPEIFQAFGVMQIAGYFTGFYNDFASYASYKSTIGDFTTDLIVRQDSLVDLTYDGKITATGFDMGKFLNIEHILGKLNMFVLVDGEGIEVETAEVRMNGIVDSLDFRGNNFNRIEIKGELANRKFNGECYIDDEFIDLDFNGKIDFSSDRPVFDFDADVHNAMLNQLHLGNRADDMKLSTKLRCNFLGTALDDLEGRIIIDSTRYIEHGKRYSVDHFALVTLKDTGLYKTILLTSDFIEADIKGNFLFAELKAQFTAIIGQYLKPDYIGLEKGEKRTLHQDMDLNILLKKTDELTELFLPALSVSEGTTIRGKLEADRKSLTLEVYSPELEYSGIRFDSLRMNTETHKRYFNVNLSSHNVVFKEPSKQDTVELGMDSVMFHARLRHDSILYMLQWNDRSMADYNTGEIQGYYSFIDDYRSIFKITHADVVINDSAWTVSPDNHIAIDSGRVHFQNFEFIGYDQHMALNGSVSENPQDTLMIDFRKWRLSNFDILINKEGLDFDGVLDGHVGFSRLFTSPGFTAEMGVQKLRMNKVLMGDASFLSEWDQQHNRVTLDAEIIHVGNAGTGKTLDLNGSYYPYRSDTNFDVDIHVSNFLLKAVGPFVDGVFNRLQGVASGYAHLQGTIQKPELMGSMRFMRTSFYVDYLNTKYEFAHEVQFDQSGFLFDGLKLYDTLGNTAEMNGKIAHRNLRDFSLDLNIRPENLLCLNTTGHHNDAFYGSALATGDVTIEGPLDNLNFDIAVTTNRGTDIYMPLKNTVTLTQNDYIVFIDSKKDTISGMLPERDVHAKGVSLQLNINVTNDAEVQIFLPNGMGDLVSRGSGNIRLGISPSEDFNIVGDYIIERGTFLFKIQNLLRKRFEIMRGGKIVFTGSPYDARINVKALYKVKTTLAGLGSDLDDAYAGQRINVDCILYLKGKLMNPDIRFGLKFPNLETEVEQVIYSILDTNDQALMNQQMISLLVLNSFSYTTSGNVGISSFNLISNQLSNWLSQISRDFDVGINYRPGDEITEDEIQVALSTQLFDDRLIIDGNLGVSSGEHSQNASNIVGDVNIEYKLTRDGRIRLRAFNRSNNINNLEDIAPYTQGVGIFYKKEFNSFGDLFRRRNSRNP